MSDEILIRRIAGQRQLLGVEDIARDVQLSLRSHARILDKIRKTEQASQPAFNVVLRETAKHSRKLAKKIDALREHLRCSHEILREIG